ncbi:MAG: hypothetical protein P8010_16050, partial [Desulfosarcinaceae bacterium]
MLNQARTRGAALMAGEVTDIQYSALKKPSVTVVDGSGKKSIIQSDFLAIATGVNPLQGKAPNPVFRSFMRINPGFS